MYNLKNKTLFKINKIVKELFDIEIHEDNYNENLLGTKIGLDPIDLVYLYNELVKIFDEKTLKKIISSGKFNTINNIITELEKSCESN